MSPGAKLTLYICPEEARGNPTLRVVTEDGGKSSNRHTCCGDNCLKRIAPHLGNSYSLPVVSVRQKVKYMINIFHCIFSFNPPFGSEEGGLTLETRKNPSRWATVFWQQGNFLTVKIQWSVLPAKAGGTDHSTKPDSLRRSTVDRLVYNQPAHTWIEIRTDPAGPAKFRSMYDQLKAKSA